MSFTFIKQQSYLTHGKTELDHSTPNCAEKLIELRINQTEKKIQRFL